MKFNTFELENLVSGDIPFNDLTSDLVCFSGRANLDIVARSEICLSCLDVVSDICTLYGIKSWSKFANSLLAQKGDVIFNATGEFSSLHAVYKSIQNLLEHACGIATTANSLVKIVKSVNKNCEILVTRKSFPFAKKLCLKAALEGGANIHRTGLSDSILFFENHLVAYENVSEFLRKIPEFKAKLCERKIIVECSDIKFARETLEAGADGVQCDKMSVEDVARVVEFKNSLSSNLLVLAAGGINETNAANYAKTGVNALVTSYVYRGLADLGAKISL